MTSEYCEKKLNYIIDYINNHMHTVYPSDYDAHLYMKDIADRIAADAAFDKKCKQLNLEHKRHVQHKKQTSADNA